MHVLFGIQASQQNSEIIGGDIGAQFELFLRTNWILIFLPSYVTSH